MDLHLHLSAAFRALDREWGTPVDLDTSGDALPGLPAVVELPNTTFSSESFLRRVRRNRPKPYSRTEHKRRKNCVKLNDSFSNISVSRMSLYKDEDNISDRDVTYSSDTCDMILGAMNQLAEDLKQPLEETFVILPSITSSTTTLDSSSQEKDELHKVFKEFKVTALTYIGKKFKRKVDK